MGLVADPSQQPIYDANALAYIERNASLHGVDPFVALAIVPMEGGLSGAVGDNGSSFGPWQLHVGGALPAGMLGDNARRWANSPAGINYALDKLHAAIGDGRGTTAIERAVRQFERPANPGPEIEGAYTNYYRLTAYQQAPSDIDLAEFNKAVHGTGKVTNKSASDAGSYDAGDAAHAIGEATGLTAIGDFFNALQNADLWIRVGLGVAGLALIVLGGRVMFS